MPDCAPRIGLFGGSFNPVHLGHLLIAQAALEEVPLDRVFFIPAAQSPFKAEVPSASGADRLRMLRLALAGHTRFSVDPQEVERGGISYSVETVRVFARRYPEARLYYLIGADHLPQLPRWREAASLAELVEFIVISRPGEANLSAPEPFRTVALNGFPLALSASQIRFRVQAGLPLSGLLPDAVAEAIRNNRLYL